MPPFYYKLWFSYYVVATCECDVRGSIIGDDSKEGCYMKEMPCVTLSGFTNTKYDYIYCTYDVLTHYPILSKISSSLTVSIFQGYQMVADKKECKGREISQWYVSQLPDCAKKCKGKSSMFAYGRSIPKHSKNRCNASGCMCLCETDGNSAGKCSSGQVTHEGYSLYKFI